MADGYRIALGFVSVARLTDLGDAMYQTSGFKLPDKQQFVFSKLLPDLSEFEFDTNDILDSLSFTWTFVGVVPFIRHGFVYVNHMRGRVDTQE